MTHASTGNLQKAVEPGQTLTHSRSDTDLAHVSQIDTDTNQNSEGKSVNGEECEQTVIPYTRLKDRNFS